MGIATVRLSLVDTGSRPLVDPNVRVEFSRSDGTKLLDVTVPVTGEDHIDFAVPAAGINICAVILTPTRYRGRKLFVRAQDDATTTTNPVMFPVNPAKVTGIQAPSFEALPAELQRLLTGAQLQGFLGRGQALYDTLPSLLKAALLNFYAKSSVTELKRGEPVFPFLGEPTILLQDRIFAKTTADLLEEAMISHNFHQVPFQLHHDVPPYVVFDSYKTLDAAGNLQLTFARNGPVGNDYLVDMDIDQSQGFGHVFEVIRNETTDTKTNPYDIREILLVTQNIQPLYSFEFAEAATAVATPSVA